MKDTRTRPYFLCLLGYFSIGAMVLTANTVLTPIEQEFGISHSQSAALITCLSMANLAMSVAGSVLTERLGRHRMLVIYAALIAGSYGLLATLPGVAVYYPLMILAGFAWGGINSLTNTVVTQMYNGAASRLTLLHACYSLAAVLFPLIMGLMLRAGINWRIPVLMVAALGLALLIVSVLQPLPEEKKPEQDRNAPAQRLAFWREPWFYACSAVMLLYVGCETASSSWLSGFLNEVNPFFAEHVPAETMVSLMWGMILAGRLLFATVGAGIDRRLLLILLSSGFLLGMCGVVLFGGTTWAAILCVAVAGLGMSAMYAGAVANSSRYIGGSGLAAGILYGLGGLGSAVIPYLAGLISDIGGRMAGMVSLCVFLAGLVAASALTAFFGYREQHRERE